jgi:hypothetical protein
VTSSVAFTFANARADSPEIRLSELILRPCGFRRNNKTRPIDLLIFPSPPRVKSAVLTARPSLPVYPAKQTFSVFVGMSQTCHEATRTEAFAPAFRAGRFPGFPKKSPPCRQWIGNENPRRDLGARDRRSPLRRRMSRIAKGHSFGPAV